MSMVNKVQNDFGQWVEAVGAPASIERVKVERPKLLDRINSLYFQSFDSPGRAVDEAVQMIRDAGIRSELETRSLLSASAYSQEGPGTVTQLVMSVSSNVELTSGPHGPQRI
jgi:hypothetical protein